jgi:N-acetylglutamate synthase-like GNAT family acetyltransferase
MNLDLNTVGVATDKPNLALSYIYDEDMNQSVQTYRITACHQNQNIGRVIVHVYGGVCQLKTLEIDIDCRRQGVGRGLMQELIKFMQKLDISPIWIRDYEPEVGNFLMALGFCKKGVVLEFCINPAFM